MFLNDVGTQNYQKYLDIDAWAFCYHLSCKPQHFYPPEFGDAAREIMQADLSLTRENITIDNAEQVYTHLVNVLE